QCGREALDLEQLRRRVRRALAAHGIAAAFGAVAGGGQVVQRGHQREPSGRFFTVESGFGFDAPAGFLTGSPIWIVSPLGTMRALPLVSSRRTLWLFVALRRLSLSSSL